ncbi:MAG: type 4a pilus biogenesis protein PilO [Gammaproteobacteria bacterium]|nr:type 4a pilus biogenesis protein PilO [Gammaproteobacteria bacterium]MDH3560990.1 type 4a pilus biogenesis protein PilO [Gammaproteobacteria bacterium]
MNLDLGDLDLANVAIWPAAARAIVILFLMLGVIFLGYWFHTKDQLVDLENLAAKEKDLKVQFERKAKKAANLEAYQQQLAEMRESFGAMLRQLPNKTEVADLLVDVSQTGLASGLEFELFKPQGERPQEFYAELPINITVIGDYHEFGNFVSGVASLPRIVTLHNVSIAKRKTKDSPLVMNLIAKTYRYLEQDERTQEAGK